jgi:hypothetical protein
MNELVDFNRKHRLHRQVRTVELRKCWWVYFDVNGNAPEDKDIVACATKEMAQEILEWFKSMKDDEKEPYVVIDGKKYSGLCSFGVEDYNFDTYYDVREGEAADDEIFTSLAEAVKRGEIFDMDEATTEVDGVYYAEGKTDEE